MPALSASPSGNLQTATWDSGSMWRLVVDGIGGPVLPPSPHTMSFGQLVCDSPRGWHLLLFCSTPYIPFLTGQIGLDVVGSTVALGIWP